jgi:hypothetical protein
MAFIPIADLDKLPQLLQQLFVTEVGAKNRANPFKFGAEKRKAAVDKQLVSIPIIRIVEVLNFCDSNPIPY